MKPINEDRLLTPAYPAEGPLAPTALPANRFLSLRTKFVLYFTLILIIACSAMSWFFIENRRTAMASRLQQLGTFLLASVLNNEHFLSAGLEVEARTTLDHFIEGLVAIEDAV